MICETCRSISVRTQAAVGKGGNKDADPVKLRAGMRVEPVREVEERRGDLNDIRYLRTIEE